MATPSGHSQSFVRDVSTANAIVVNNRFSSITEVGSTVARLRPEKRLVLAGTRTNCAADR
jgi:hypothetical protein